jgi:hypothetical protein
MKCWLIEPSDEPTAPFYANRLSVVSDHMVFQHDGIPVGVFTKGSSCHVEWIAEGKCPECAKATGDGDR